MRYVVNVQFSIEATTHAQAAEFIQDRLSPKENFETLPLYAVADSLGNQKVFDMEGAEPREVK